MKKKNISVEEALETLAAGGMIILTDDEERENEGDLVGAARFADPAMVNFMASRGKGLICCALEESLCRRAGLQPLEGNQGPDALHGTNFCTPVDLIAGCTTGISAQDRSATLRRLVHRDCSPEDFARPGHMFPLLEAPGGLKARQGHTEATVELCRLAGLEGAAVICEILDDDGTMARGPRLEELARRWDLGILSIAELIRWREEAPRNSSPQEDPVRLPTSRGAFDLEFLPPSEGGSTGGDHLCLIRRREDSAPAPHPQGPLVRIHSECLTGDLFGSRRCDCGRQLAEAQRLIDREGEGYLIYLRQEGRGIGLRAKMAAYQLQDAGLDTLEANLRLGYREDERSYEGAARYLLSKGVRSIRLLTNNPDKIEQLRRAGLTVQRVPLLIPPEEENRRYMETKQEKMGHLTA